MTIIKTIKVTKGLDISDYKMEYKGYIRFASKIYNDNCIENGWGEQDTDGGNINTHVDTLRDVKNGFKFAVDNGCNLGEKIYCNQI